LLRSRPGEKKMEDASLGRDTRLEDVVAFRDLFDSHGDRMKSLAYNLLGNESDAEDAVQEAFLKAYRSASGFRGRSAFSTWVYRILVNACHDMRRKRRRKEEPLEAEPEAVERHARSAGSPRHQLRLDLEKALARLVPLQKTVFVLYEVEGFRHGEIGEMLEIPEGTSKNLLFRAKRELQEILLTERQSLNRESM